MDNARAHTRDLDQLAEGVAFVMREEAEQQLRVFAHDEVRQQRDPLTERRQVVEARHRHVDLVAHAFDIEKNLRRGFFRQIASEPSDHAGSVASPFWLNGGTGPGAALPARPRRAS
jgi:hypothetical protein